MKNRKNKETKATNVKKLMIEVEYTDDKQLYEISNILNEIQRQIKEKLSENKDLNVIDYTVEKVNIKNKPYFIVKTRLSSQKKQNWVSIVNGYTKNNNKINLKYDYDIKKYNIGSKKDNENLIVFIPKSLNKIIAINSSDRYYFAIVDNKLERLKYNDIPKYMSILKKNNQ